MSSLAEIASLLDASSVFLFLVTLVVFSLPVFIIFPPVPVERSDALGQTHSKVGVPERESRLRDQWTRPAPDAGSAPGQAGPGQPPRIHSLHIYPLKSCRGIELAEATVLPSGLEHDRVFCLAQRKTKPARPTTTTTATTSSSSSSSAPPQPADYWEVLTLRQMASMANIQVDLWVPDPAKRSRQLGPMDGDSSFLVVRFPFRSPGLKGLIETAAAKLSRSSLRAAPEREFMLPLAFPSAREVAARGYAYAEVMHFRNVIPALDMGAELPAELALYLGLEPDRLSLFRLDPDERRHVFGCAPTRDEAGYQPEIDFQDAKKTLID